MASAARQKQAKKAKRRTGARGKRVARPGARPTRGSATRTRTAANARLKRLRVAKQRVKKKLASAKRALKVAVAKRIVKKRVASLKRSVAKRLSRAHTRVRAAKKRAIAARKALRKRVTKTVRAASKRTTVARAAFKKRVTRTVRAANRRTTTARAVLSKVATKAVKTVKSTLEHATQPLARRVALAKVPPAFAAQRANATPREELMFELQRARASVKAAVQGLGTGLAESPIAPGKWSIKEIVLHISERDRVRLEEFARTLGGQPRSWAETQKREESDQNEAHLSPLRAHSWDDALRRLDTMREQLLLRLSEVPAEPDDVWRHGHPFADMMWALPGHDRLHASQIKLARIGANDPVED